MRVSFRVTVFVGTRVGVASGSGVAVLMGVKEEESVPDAERSHVADNSLEGVRGGMNEVLTFMVNDFVWDCDTVRDIVPPSKEYDVDLVEVDTTE